MKKLSLILVILALLTITGCKDNKKNFKNSGIEMEAVLYALCKNHRASNL